MAGTLLSSNKEPVAPPPFNPSLAKKGGASKTASATAAEPAPTAAAKSDDASDTADASGADASSAAAEPPKDPPALPVTGIYPPRPADRMRIASCQVHLLSRVEDKEMGAS